ncbi:MAG: MerR family transcriptional regulator [Paludibacterium sp.]|uniref:MerR family transcriptional regulator n=1 Tax=Paludibacterium sp. TaxID=1917523 RepID=UPI0025D3E7BF|nr:MerR family transcriptional regulator [Paludibacterium sp.]MBV8048779.1 MerR family transcriptional regulator [Paludibacterium sp.]MBV8648836.1 MerR family transcriptional regulator [Paludibacterium sp.]
MFTITQLARQFGLSRSTLLYYDRIGLLRPSGRSHQLYRLYSDEDRERLEAICRYRRAGLPLEQLPALLEPADQHSARGVLARHLNDLSRRIDALRAQQESVARLLLSGRLTDSPQPLDKTALTAMLHAAGLSDAQLDQLHAGLEATHPEAHQAFLERLGASPADIAEIRAHSRRLAEQSANAR